MKVINRSAQITAAIRETEARIVDLKKLAARADASENVNAFAAAQWLADEIFDAQCLIVTLQNEKYALDVPTFEVRV